jgi:hypothetical protein
MKPEIMKKRSTPQCPVLTMTAAQLASAAGRRGADLAIRKVLKWKRITLAIATKRRPSISASRGPLVTDRPSFRVIVVENCVQAMWLT